jgi:penicillin amidase
MDESAILRAMRGDVTVEDVCATAGISLPEFREARDALLRRRLPPADLRLTAGVGSTVEILRDRRGVPHIYAEGTGELSFGLGLAMAQDRLWQMDLFRRRGWGTLATVLGPAYLASDRIHATLGLGLVAKEEAELLDPGTEAVLTDFVAGINRWIDAAENNLPIEFDLLGYRPEPWRVVDVIVALRGFWWSLNGRLQSIVAGEAAKLLPEGPLRDAFLTPNLADERILPAGSPYPEAPAFSVDTLVDSPFAGSDESATGSNNWAVGAGRTTTGAALLGSDPHQPFALPANWYECRLVGPEDDLAGAAWAGVPGIWFGRNRSIAWGLTNNNVSLRDLYVEEVDPNDPTRYRDGDGWRVFGERVVDLAVKGQGQPERLVVLETVRGPLVNKLIPPVRAEGDPPLSLRWVGFEHVEDVRSLLAVNRAKSWDEFRDALRGWAIPTFNWGYADAAGNVGYLSASRLPIRGRATRGYREANNPADEWDGYVPFEALPQVLNPPRGFTSSANNAPVPDDYPYPYVGAFASGERATRIRETIEQTTAFDRAACAALQNDTLSAVARQLWPALILHLRGSDDPDLQLLYRELEGWDYRYENASRAPACFEAFLAQWKERIAAEWFPPHLVGLTTGQGNLYARLLLDDDLGWFPGDKAAIIRDCARAAVKQLRANFGDDPAGWAWGKVHQAYFHHPLSNPATADVFDVGPLGVAGAASTVRNTGLGANPLFAADSGAEYRLIADLADPSRIWGTQNIGQSGQPGSPHYADQFLDWAYGEYHAVALVREAVEAEKMAVVRIVPMTSPGIT